MTDGTTLYLTTLECEDGHRQTYSHEGPIRPLDQSAPMPEVEFCPTCTTGYDHDADVVEVHEAETVLPERARSDDLYERALDCWGESAQRAMAVEECAEVIVEECHFNRGRASREELVEEFVDVLILMEQMRVTFAPQFEEIYERKIRRLESRVEDAEPSGHEIGGDRDES